jgi:hypothetical protein
MKYLLIIIMLSFSAMAYSQNKSYLDFGVGAAKKEQIITVGYYKNWNLSKSKKLFKNIFVGTGIRGLGYFGKDKYFTSAPPSLYGTTDEDSLFAPKPALYSINSFVNFGYNISKKIQVGFNLDVIGFSFGPTGSPNFISNGISTVASASPTKLNALLVGANDIGTLNGGLFVSYKLNDKIGFRVSYHTLFTELKTKQILQTIPSQNDRFRHGSNPLGIGFNYYF